MVVLEISSSARLDTRDFWDAAIGHARTLAAFGTQRLDTLEHERLDTLGHSRILGHRLDAAARSGAYLTPPPEVARLDTREHTQAF